MRARELLAADQRQVGVLEVVDAVAGGELGAGPLADDLAFVDEGDPVAELLGLLDVVRGEQDRRPLLVDPLHVVPELEPQLDVDAGGRLVEDQQARPVHHRPRQDQPPFHPAREGAGAFVALLGQREGLEQLLGPLAPLALRHAEVAGVVVERLLDGEEPVEVDLLRRQPDRLPRLAVVVDRVVAEDLDRAPGRLREPGRAVDQRRLAGAVGPQQAEQLPRLDLQRDAAQRLDPGRVALGQVLDVERVHLPAIYATASPASETCRLRPIGPQPGASQRGAATDWAAL